LRTKYKFILAAPAYLTRQSMESEVISKAICHIKENLIPEQRNHLQFVLHMAHKIIKALIKAYIISIYRTGNFEKKITMHRMQKIYASSCRNFFNENMQFLQLQLNKCVFPVPFYRWSYDSSYDVCEAN